MPCGSSDIGGRKCITGTLTMPKYRSIKGRNGNLEIWSRDLCTFTIRCQKRERPDGEKVRTGVTHHIESSFGDQMDHLDWNSNHTKCPFF